MIIKCPNCGKEISNKAKKCVYCGQKITAKKSAAMKIATVVAVCVLLGALIWFFLFKKSGGANNAANFKITSGFADIVNQYDTITSFLCIANGNELACVRKNGKYGLINLKGELVVPCEYDENIFVCLSNDRSKERTSSKYSGFARVRKNGRDGVMNLQTYSLVVPCESDEDESRGYRDYVKFTYRGGYFWMCKNKKWGLYDPNGNKLTDFVYDDITTAYDYPINPVNRNGMWDFVDIRSGKELSDSFRYKNIYYADQGFKGVISTRRVYDDVVEAFFEEETETEIIDTNGLILTTSDLLSLKQNATNSIVEDSPDEIKPTIVSGQYNVIEGLLGNDEKSRKYFRVQDLMGGWGAITQTGEVVIPCEYDEIEGLFSEKGDAIFGVRRGNKWGVYNSKGNEVYPIDLDAVNRYSCGLVHVKKNKKVGFVDLYGNSTFSNQ